MKCLENFRKAIEDSKEAWTLNPSNVKSYFRAARAAASLKRQEEALKYIEIGLEKDPKNAELLKERDEVNKSLEARIAADAVERKKKEERDNLRAKMMSDKKDFYEVRTNFFFFFFFVAPQFFRLLSVSFCFSNCSFKKMQITEFCCLFYFLDRSI
jgi:tetratricopeptide (TPR) repeat protein